MGYRSEVKYSTSKGGYVKVRYRYWEEVVETYDVVLEAPDEIAGDDEALMEFFEEEKERLGAEFYQMLGDRREAEVVESGALLA